MNTNETVIIVAFLGFAAFFFVGFLVYYMFRRYLMLREREMHKMSNVVMDDFRSHLERDIVKLNERFASSDERWREVNHLVLAGQKVVPDVAVPALTPAGSNFLRSHGIAPMELGLDERMVFVLTPFHKDFSDEFLTLVEVGQRIGLAVVRGDERMHSGEIFPQLLRLMVRARVVIANISGRNPNVFYELGIAHALDKPVILLAHKHAEVPFDLKSKQIIFYENNQNLANEVSAALARIMVGA